MINIFIVSIILAQLGYSIEPSMIEIWTNLSSLIDLLRFIFTYRRSHDSMINIFIVSIILAQLGYSIEPSMIEIWTNLSSLIDLLRFIFTSISFQAVK